MDVFDEAISNLRYGPNISRNHISSEPPNYSMINLFCMYYISIRQENRKSALVFDNFQKALKILHLSLNDGDRVTLKRTTYENILKVEPIESDQQSEAGKSVISSASYLPIDSSSGSSSIGPIDIYRDYPNRLDLIFDRIKAEKIFTLEEMYNGHSHSYNWREY
ncbi:hypothetical protein Glove_232g181 [Diversispora epigaea]|uniref:Uncharacterized protein n=1 Tax=Diversispora epigaea TaxID=1348612 RepID=A0A397IHK4_9GLOM|nr:hypothetical protein Glove_232g181 [Diversispora epigaea]